MAGETIPTMANPKRIPLKGGGFALVRRATRGMRDKLLRVAEVKEGDAASMAYFGQLAFRWGVVGIEEADLKNPETGEPVKFGRRALAGLGNIATEDVYNAIGDDEDLSKIIVEVVPQSEDGGVLSDDQRGN